jgi:ABC-type transport system substrate-binding protein
MSIATFSRGLKTIVKSLSLWEKIILGVATITILTTSTLWWVSYISQWQDQPLPGGTYHEGIVNADTNDVDALITKLTKIGLTYTDHNNTIQAALAKSWEISEDGKLYTFHMQPGVKATEIAALYSALPNWSNIPIVAINDQTITMTLKQPFSPLLSFTSDPVIERGPYSVEKRTTTEIIFAANPDFSLGQPHLQRIVLTFYPDGKSAKAALQRQEIAGADQPFKGMAGTEIKKLDLTDFDVLLFNLQRQLFKDKAIREKIKNNQKLDTPIKATLVTTQDPQLLERANQFSKEVAGIGLEVSIKSVNPVTLDRDIIPNDDYDLLLTTYNYGYDQDPYPFWHSSQVIPPGKNYSGFKNKDADKLIEEARQTQDPTARTEKYKAFQQILEGEIPAIFYPNHEFSFTISEKIRGETDGIAALPADRYTGIWQWYLKYKKVKR